MSYSLIKFSNYNLDHEDDGEITINPRYILDGASTLSEAAELAEAYADFLRDLESNGYQLEDVIQRGLGIAANNPVANDETDAIF